MDAAIRIVVATLTLAGSVSWCASNAQTVDLSVHGFRSDATVPISDLTKRSLEYPRMPISQVADMDFSARVTNQGNDTAINLIVSLHATFEGTDLGTFSSDTLLELLPGATDTMVILAGLDAQVNIGDLQFVFQVSAEPMDTFPVNNIDTVLVRVDDLFARAEEGWSDTLGLTQQVASVALRYEVLEETVAYGVAVVLPLAVDGVDLICVGSLYDSSLAMMTNSPDMLVYPWSTSPPGEADWQWLCFLEPQELLPDHDYYAGLTVYGVEPWAFAVNGPALSQSAFINDEDPDQWLPLYHTPMLALIMDGSGWGPCMGSVEEFQNNAAVLLPLIPNPARSNARLVFRLKSSAPVVVEVCDHFGRLVLNEPLGARLSGEQIYELDVSRFTNGAYACSLVVEGQRLTRQLVVLH